jgi:DNA-binding MarR family transcriptional regulator
LGRQLVLESITARNEWITHFGTKLTSEEREQIGQAFRVLVEKVEE